MRAELKELINQIDELDTWHFKQTIELCQSLNDSHWQHTHAPFVGGDVSNQDYIEALADQNFQTASEVHYIWQLGLWRLQAIFEGLIEQNFLGNSKAYGLRRKLKRLVDRGFTLSADEATELLEWANLRNALSHRPVTATSVSQQLDRSDLEAVAALYSGIVQRWRRQRADRDILSPP